MNRAYRALEEAIGYEFKDKKLLHLALTHRSYQEREPGVKSHNQRLEYLGDAVLQLYISQELYSRFPSADESALSQARAALVCEQSLRKRARKLGLGEYLYLGKGEEQAGARDRSSTLADAMEALIGAIYLDGGHDATRQFVMRIFSPFLEDIMNPANWLDVKTSLILLLSATEEIPLYEIVRESGPDHDREFEAEVSYQGKFLGRGIGKSKKEAERQAARNALENFSKTEGQHHLGTEET
ncbi:MAG: ribonuclease III [Christensenellales bacterium]|jgi:ribonuclease-3